MQTPLEEVEESKAGKEVHEAGVLGEAVEDAADGVPMEEGNGAG